MDPSLVVPVSTSGDYRTPSSSLSPASIPFTVDLDDARSDIGIEVLETTTPVGVGSARRTFFSGKLFSLKNNKTKRAGQGLAGASNWGTRMFDYKEKYPADEWGAEMGDESRFCKMYVDECEIYDLERMESWRDALDVLLVFIGLFSAIVTTFVIQTSQALQPDYGQITATLVYNLVLVQSAVANGTTISIPALEDPAKARVHSLQIDKWVNGLWFTSLAISLSTALVTVLTKQWLYHYMSQTSGTSKDRALLRQFRFAGLEKYGVPVIIDLLPIALHLALALFLAGLSLFLHSLDKVMASVVVVVSGTVYAAYIVSAFIPLYDPQCPYQSPISSYINHALILLYSIQRWIICRGLACSQQWNRLRNRLASWYYGTLMSPPDDTPLNKRYDKWAFHPRHQRHSLQTQERLAVLQHRNQLEIDTITWLYSTSANSTVREISFMAVSGISPSHADMRSLKDVALFYYLQQHASSSFHSRRMYTAMCFPDFHRPSIPVSSDRPEFEWDVYDQFAAWIAPALSNENPRLRTKLSMADFLAPGRYSNAKFPLAIWRTCIPEFALHPWDSITITRLLSETETPPGEMVLCGSPATFADALKGNFHLRSLILTILAERFAVSKGEVTSFTSMSLLFAIMQSVLPKVSILKHHETYAGFEWGDTSERSAFSLLDVCLKACGLADFQLYQLETYGDVRNICTFVLGYDLTSANSDYVWPAWQSSIYILYIMWYHCPTLHCPPDLFARLLVCVCTHFPPWTTTTMAPYFIVPHIILRYKEPEMLYNTLREFDPLPIEPANSQTPCSDILRSPLWSYEMCRAAVFAEDEQKVDPSAEWVIRWIHYIDCPERLHFLFSHLLCGRMYMTAGIPLTDRVKPLLEVTATSSHWTEVFPSLIALFDDDDYIESILECADARKEFYDVLCYMQAPNTLRSVDLTIYELPKYDESGQVNLRHIEQQNNINLPAVVSPLSLVEPVVPLDSPSTSSTTAQVWTKTKAVVRFSKSTGSGHTPRKLEEAEDLDVAEQLGGSV